MHASLFTRRILLLFSGPIAWAVHFLGVYAAVGVACARGGTAWLGPALAGACIAACAVIAAILWRARRRHDAAPGADFVKHVATGLGWLAAVAILWETVAVLLVPACVSAA